MDFMNSPRRISAVTIAVAVGISGCTSHTPAPAPPVASAPSTVTVTATPSPANGAPTPTLPNGGYNATSRAASGTDGTVTYDVTMPAVTGPNQAVVDAFNNSVDASLHQQITALQHNSIPSEWRLTTYQNQQAVWLGNNTISGLWITSADTPHEAHGSYHIATFVINTATAQRVMLADVFGDLGSALQRLSQNATTQLSAKLGDMFRPGGVAPTAENFANWIPTSDGIELHFNDYQVGPHGLPVITVPWTVFDGIPMNNVR
jgi:Protein of unknown function (DUF3298)